ncbi:MAG: outer membrane porin GjpA, partial [Mycobacterium sp.]
MQTLRPYATTGVAIAAASLIAVTPVAAPLPDIGTFRDVALTAGEDTASDLASPWTDVFNTASENATTLWDNFALAPAVGLQQALVNQSDLWQQFFNDPTSSTLASVFQEMQTNLDNVLTGIGLQGTSP